MPSLNKVILIGNLTATPELKKTNNGISTCSFSIGVQRKYKGANGNAETDFINIRAWRATAEFVCKYFTKGNPICVVGSLQVSQYTNAQGQKQTWTEVVADEVNFIANKSSAGSFAPPVDSMTPPPEYGNQQPSYTPPAYSSGEGESADKFEELSSSDDLPF